MLPLKKIKSLAPIFTILTTLPLLLISQAVSAHVKWFAEYDITSAPTSITSVLTPSFLQIALLSILVILGIFLLEKSEIGSSIDKKIQRCRAYILSSAPSDYDSRIIRYALLIFFTCIWAKGGIILTPELMYSDSFFVNAIQLAIIFGLFTPKSSIYSGIGIIILWLYSAVHYGVFHLSDYVIFLGLAVLLILMSLQQGRLIPQGFIILYASISITLQWASIEKFVYPIWSFPLLVQEAHLTMGFDKEIFMEMAGFVEFVFAFLLVTTTGIGFIFATLGLAIIFLLAIIDFGKIDAIGHLAIIVSLLVMSLKGPTQLNIRLSNWHSHPLINALIISCVFSLSLVTFFALYYGIRLLWMKTAAGPFIALTLVAAVILLIYSAFSSRLKTSTNEST